MHAAARVHDADDRYATVASGREGARGLARPMTYRFLIAKRSALGSPLEFTLTPRADCRSDRVCVLSMSTDHIYSCMYASCAYMCVRINGKRRDLYGHEARCTGAFAHRKCNLGLADDSCRYSNLIWCTGDTTIADREGDFSRVNNFECSVAPRFVQPATPRLKRSSLKIICGNDWRELLFIFNGSPRVRWWAGGRLGGKSWKLFDYGENKQNRVQFGFESER